MTEDQLKAEKLVRILEIVAMIGCMAVMTGSMAVMIATTWENPNPMITHLYLMLFGSTLLSMAFTVADTLSRKPRVIIWKVLRSRLTLIHSQAIEATDWSFLETDTLLFSTGQGEMSNLLPVEEVQPVIEVLPPPLVTKSVDIAGPGFIYVMRRADGIYKLGRAVDPIQRLEAHQESYKQNFTLIRAYAVPDMVAFEQLALRRTKDYTYKKEAGRRELRKMTKRQLAQFMIEFERVVKSAN